MHDCPNCGYACDCDGEDHYNSAAAAECACTCEHLKDAYGDDFCFEEYGDEEFDDYSTDPVESKLAPTPTEIVIRVTNATPVKNDCPFCGANANQIEAYYSLGYANIYYHRCQQCGARGPSNIKGEDKKSAEEWDFRR